MNKIKFQIGDTQFIRVNFDYIDPEDQNILVGKIVVNMNKTKSSTYIKVNKNELFKFIKKSAKLYEKLKGTVILNSIYNSEIIKLSAIETGNIVISINISNYSYDNPYNTSWTLKGEFIKTPYCLEEIVDIYKQID